MYYLKRNKKESRTKVFLENSCVVNIADLPPKADFERKIKEILHEAQERLQRRKTIKGSEIHKQINYFYEPKDDV